MIYVGGNSCHAVLLPVNTLLVCLVFGTSSTAILSICKIVTNYDYDSLCSLRKLGTVHLYQQFITISHQLYLGVDNR